MESCCYRWLWTGITVCAERMKWLVNRTARHKWTTSPVFCAFSCQADEVLPFVCRLEWPNRRAYPQEWFHVHSRAFLLAWHISSTNTYLTLMGFRHINTWYQASLSGCICFFMRISSTKLIFKVTSLCKNYYISICISHVWLWPKKKKKATNVIISFLKFHP